MYLVAFPGKKLLGSPVILYCSMILIITFSPLPPLFRARQTGIPDFLSSQSALHHNLLSKPALSAELSAVLRHTRWGGDKLGSADSSAANLETVRSARKAAAGDGSGFSMWSPTGEGAWCWRANLQRSVVALGCAERVFSPPYKASSQRPAGLTLLPTCRLLPWEHGLLWNAPSRCGDFSLSRKAWAARLRCPRSLFWFGHGSPG